MPRLIPIAIALCLAFGGIGALLFLILSTERFGGFLYVIAGFVAAIGVLWLWDHAEKWRRGS
jgi:hypothetical protein